MPIRRSLVELARLIRTRQISPVEAMRATLAQIERMNPSINAFMEIRAEAALEEAKHAEALLMQGSELPSLLGVPVTLKDCFDLAGHATRTGSLLRRNEIASTDSWAAARFRAAGAVIVGKTSTPEFLMNYETDNHYIGRTNNPWNLDRTSGGSSGGEAAAIAAFCSAGGIGSDGGGSIREPAHFCGICGLKPTPGRIPLTGHWPVSGHPTGFMGVGGPMARTAADVRALYSLLAGDDAGDPFSVPLPAFPDRGAGAPSVASRRSLPGTVAQASACGVDSRVDAQFLPAHDTAGPGSPLSAGPLPRRVAVLEQSAEAPVQPAVRQAVRRAAEILAGMGIDVVPFDFEALRGAHELWRFFFVNVLNALLRPMIAGRESKCHWTGLELIDTVRDAPAPTLLELCAKLAERDALRERFLRKLAPTPVLLMPAFGVTAFPHRQRRFPTDAGEIGLLDAIRVVSPANLLGLPSMTVPVGFDADGLPAGVQFVGMPWSEPLLLDLAVAFEGARGSFPAPALAAK
jgi:Asp-tRNA(Asn)/Glu-tRNA(Gln) amidotransferase A subunit family amidase